MTMPAPMPRLPPVTRALRPERGWVVMRVCWPQRPSSGNGGLHLRLRVRHHLVQGGGPAVAEAELVVLVAAGLEGVHDSGGVVRLVSNRFEADHGGEMAYLFEEGLRRRAKAGPERLGKHQALIGYNLQVAVE